MIIAKENRITSLGLLGIILSVFLFFIAIAMLFERYITDISKKMFFRLLLLTFLIEIGLIMFLIFSFSKLKFTVGPVGPQGIRGRRGLPGQYDTVIRCRKQTEKLGQYAINNKKAENVIIQKPVLGTGGHPPNEDYYN